MNPVQAEEYRRRYLADQIETTAPEQRLLMLFDRLERDLDGAREGFEINDIEKISTCLVHAQHILFALRDPLDQSTSLGESLGAVYSYCLRRLVDANIKKDVRALREVQPLLGQIAQANRQAAASVSTLLSNAS